MSKRVPTPADLAVDFLASRDRGAGIAELAPSVLEAWVVEQLRADPRLVQTPGGAWQLAAKLEQRARAMAGAG